MIFFDFEMRELPFLIQIVIKYISPLLLAYYALYIVPRIVYKVEQLNKFERKSEKEESFMSSSIRIMTCNCLILPYFGSTLINYFFGEP